MTERKVVDEKEIKRDTITAEDLDAMCGREVDGTSRAIVCLQIMRDDGVTVEKVDSVVAFDAEMQISIADTVKMPVIVDLIFSDHTDYEYLQCGQLMVAWDLIKKDLRYHLMVTISSAHDDLCKHMMLCDNPTIWGFTSVLPEGDNHVIRMGFADRRQVTGCAVSDDDLVDNIVAIGDEL